MQRLSDEKFKNHYVRVSFLIDEGNISFDIKDDGKGFHWEPFLSVEEARISENNGRGIAVAYEMSFDELTYLERGNRVQCQIKN